MEYMFFNCHSLVSVNLNKFNTENVKKMNYMFFECCSLTSINIIITDNTIDLSSMFQSCTSLTSINFSKYNTINVKKMNKMFYNCTKLKYIDISSFKYNTSYKYTSYQQLFVNLPIFGQITLHRSFMEIIIDQIPFFWTIKKIE